MKNTIIALIAILILIVGGIFLFNREEAPLNTVPADEESSVATPSDSSSLDEESETVDTSTVKEFTISSEGFSFSQDEIRVNEGDTVRVTFVNTGGTHDWRLEGYDIGTEVIQTGEQETVEFVADQAGSFFYYCSVGSHRAMGMEGVLIVE